MKHLYSQVLVRIGFFIHKNELEQEISRKLAFCIKLVWPENGRLTRRDFVFESK